MEGRSYFVCWSRKQGKWTLWLKSRTKIRAEASTLEDAEVRLTDAIGDAYGDFEPVFTYTKPLPPAAELEPFLKDNLVIVHGAGTCECEQVPVEEVFTGGRCPHCLNRCGKRTRKPRRIENTMSEHIGSGGVMYVSEDFLSLLTATEQACMEWRLCERLRPAKRKIFEVVPRSFVKPIVPKTAEPHGWQCPKCGYQTFSCIVADQCLTVVARPARGRVFPPLFAIGQPSNFYLGMPASRVNELLASKASLGLRSDPLGVVDSRDVARPNPRRFITAEQAKAMYR